MGADIRDIEGGGHAPLAIKAAQGPLTPIEYIMPVASAQVKSCILSAGLYADGVTMVKEPFPSRDHTERILEYFEADIKKEGLSVSVSGARPLVARDIKIPGDISSAAFFIVAASVVEGSDIIIKNVGLNPTRTGLINVLKKMGAHVEILGLSDGPEPWGDIRVKYSPLKGIEVSGSEIPLLIDEVPVLMIAALQAEGITRIKGIKELKVKESDRVFTMKQNVSLLGASIDEENDAVIINGGYKAFNSAELDSYGDHRIAMSMAVASLLADKGCVVKNTSCVNISYPGFIRDLSMLTS
jgi:3-phosphoshikimate 1-carboxyvinyltransferase